jgi:hypothetical protein
MRPMLPCAPVSLRPKVDALDPLLTDAAEAAVLEGDQAMAVYLIRVGETLRQWSAGKALTGVNSNRKVKMDMEASHRQKLADARTGGKKPHPNLAAARKAKLATMADLAAALGYSRAMLSRIMSGDRTMPPEKAALFKRLTGEDWR